MCDENKIKLIILDVDGVLTDGKITVGTDGMEIKSFHVKDGMGISLAKYYGIKFAIITGRRSEAVSIRAKELNIDYVYQGVSDKKAILNELLTNLNMNYRHVCSIGDDLNDLPILLNSAISFAPQDAVDYVKKNVSHVTDASGGEGAVREMIDMILKNATDYDILVKNYLDNKLELTQ
ncbi:KdsC family phosphatase [Neobacillus drentensis]|uniref:KdsC family phosphatase n=1 Tax=Neobacillus drentensis TaxID=220684 RepID=UPI0028652473|nr:HAD hydrolase family protein [Neobacillus drentensis]MDR7239966.1 YrbI family 3-deoxy-D-manno-octulosonate 8-phosphate phosphatase [Neobacillus drentensis]